MQFQLMQDQRSMVNTVRELAQDQFRPNALKYMDGTFPWDNMKKLALALASLSVIALAAPSIANAETVIIKRGHRDMDRY